MLKQKSYSAKANEIERKWFVVDASNKTVGRIASEIAKVLRGKNKPQFTTTLDVGDFVVVTNCEKVHFTGKKWDEKEYNWHTNHVGGIKTRMAKEQLAIHPELIIYEAVKGMLPKTTMGRAQLTKLKVYKGENHPHAAQNPITLEIK